MNDNFNRYIQAFLVVAITFGFFATVFALFTRTDIPTPVKDILLVMLGALLASWKEVTSYFFGSSSGSAKKDEQNAVLTTQLAANTVVPVLGTGPTGKPGDPVSVDIENSEGNK